jgi:hypothetical protein
METVPTKGAEVAGEETSKEEVDVVVEITTMVTILKEGVAMEATLKEEAMVATLKEGAMVDIAKTTTISSNSAKVEDVPFMIDKDQMLYARFAAGVGIRRFAVGRDSTKKFKVLNAPLMQQWDHMV